MKNKSSKSSLKASVGESPTAWVYRFWAWILLIWSFYRYALYLPEWADEFIFKPLVFVLPVLWYVRLKEGRDLDSIGLTKKNFLSSAKIGLGICAVFLLEGVLSHLVKYGGFNLSAMTSISGPSMVLFLILSFATAFSEEVLNRGFLFSRLLEASGKLWFSAIVSSFMFVAFHVPLLLTTLQFHGLTLIIYFWTILVIGVVNCLLYSTKKSLVAPILIHFFWNITVAFFL